LYPRANFLDVLDGNPDLYGPFWIATTVVFILFVGGTVSQYLADTGKSNDGFRYDFRLLSGASFFPPLYPSRLVNQNENILTDSLGAAGLIYGYTTFIPLFLWGALHYFGSET